MNLLDASNALNAYLSADIPTFLWGPPGVGKSDLVRQVAAARGVPLIDFRAVLLDPVDLRGIPSIAGGITTWNPPGFLPREDRDGPEGILFMDELNAAPASVQAALFQLVLDRRLGDYTMPAGWRVVAAGNRQSDRAAAQRMPSALANRFAHIDCDSDVPAWAAWATGAGIAPEIIAFIRFRPELLHKMDTGSELRAFPTPRAWASVSKLVAAAPGMAGQLAAGLVGQGPAAELTGFLSVYRQLPKLELILSDPSGAPVPAEPSARYAIACALGRAMAPANIDSVVTYLDRLPAEFGVLAMTDAIKRDSRLKATSGFVRWAVSNQDITL